MKRILTIFLSILILSMIIKYVASSYDINYEVNGFKVRETYKDKNIYFEISKDNSYNFDLNIKRKVSKKLIDKIEIIESENEICIYPTIKGEKTYPLCNKDGENVSYHLMETEILKNFINSLDILEIVNPTKETFKFYNNLDKDEFIAVYKYNGFYILNEDRIKTINLYDNDRYDNSLCEQVGSYLVLPEDSEYNFKNFVVIDMKSKKQYKIESTYNISFDSIMLGHIKNKVYLLDQKNSRQYEIDIKKKEVELIGNYEKGFKVYKNGKLKTGMISEVKKNAGFSDEEYSSRYEYIIEEEKLYKINKKNKNIKTLIYKGNVEIINVYEEDIFFLDKDKLYKYNPINGVKTILVNEELNYSKLNTIYVYNND